MNGKPHEFFAPSSGGEVTNPTPLSTHFDIRLQQENAALRDPDFPDYFNVPGHLLDMPDKQTVAIIGSRCLKLATGEEVMYTPFQTRALNVVFSAEQPVTVDETMERIGGPASAANMRRQLVSKLYKNMSAPQAVGKLLIRQDLEGVGEAYNVNPAITFADQRVERRGKSPSARQVILQRLAKRYNNDPSVLRELEDYSVTPMGSVLPRWPSHMLARYQAKNFVRLTPDQLDQLLDELDGIIEDYKFGITTEADEKHAVVLYNKAVYSLLGLAHATAIGALNSDNQHGVRSPIFKMMTWYSKDDLSKPEDDVFALAELGTVLAVQTYDKDLGSIASHVINQVGYTIRDGVFELRRHVLGLTQHEIKEGRYVSYRRTHVEYEDGPVLSSISRPNYVAGYEYEALLSSVNSQPFVQTAFKSERLRPAEKLILSLAYGVYNSEFEGEVLQGASGQAFVYDASFSSNPLFREGLTDSELSRMFSVSVSQIARLRGAALKKVEAILRGRLAGKYAADKWKDWIWS